MLCTYQSFITQGGCGLSLLQRVDSGIMDVGHNTLVGHAAIERADLPVRVYNGMGSVGGNHLRQGREERIQRNTPSTQLHNPQRRPAACWPTIVIEPNKPGSSNPSGGAW